MLACDVIRILAVTWTILGFLAVHAMPCAGQEPGRAAGIELLDSALRSCSDVPDAAARDETLGVVGAELAELGLFDRASDVLRQVQHTAPQQKIRFAMVASLARADRTADAERVLREGKGDSGLDEESLIRELAKATMEAGKPLAALEMMANHGVQPSVSDFARAGRAQDAIRLAKSQWTKEESYLNMQRTVNLLALAGNIDGAIEFVEAIDLPSTDRVLTDVAVELAEYGRLAAAERLLAGVSDCQLREVFRRALILFSQYPEDLERDVLRLNATNVSGPSEGYSGLRDRIRRAEIEALRGDAEGATSNLRKAFELTADIDKTGSIRDEFSGVRQRNALMAHIARAYAVAGNLQQACETLREISLFADETATAIGFYFARYHSISKSEPYLRQIHPETRCRIVTGMALSALGRDLDQTIEHFGRAERKGFYLSNSAALAVQAADPKLPVSARIQRIRILGVTGPEELVHPFLRWAADAGDPEVQTAALDALARLGSDRLSTINTLIVGASDSNSNVRVAAIEALVTLGQTTSDILNWSEELLLADDDDVVCRAAAAIRRIGRCSAEGKRRLHDLTSSEHTQVALNAALALWAVEGENRASLDAFTRILDAGAREPVAKVARFAELKGPECQALVPDLVQAAKRGDAFTNIFIAKALASITGDSERSVEILDTVIDDAPNYLLTAVALDSLASLSPQITDLDSRLKVLSNHENALVAQAAQSTLNGYIGGADSNDQHPALQMHNGLKSTHDRASGRIDGSAGPDDDQ